jgi:acyl-CoA thioesterase FadM
MTNWMELKQETFRVSTFDCGADGRIHLFAIMQYLQEIAAEHAEELGFGFARMSEVEAYWVLYLMEVVS